MSEICIERLSVETIVGVNDWERVTPQRLDLDLDLGLDLSRAAASDRVEDTLDYGRACELVRAHLAEHHYFLIERLAAGVGDALIDAFDRLETVTVRVRKFDVVPGTASVGVRLIRQRRAATP